MSLKPSSNQPLGIGLPTSILPSTLLRCDIPVSQVQAENLAKFKEEISSLTGDLSIPIETHRAEQMTIKQLFYKVPTGPVTTLNFTANPYDQNSNAKKPKDKEKKKARSVKSRKPKRIRFCEISKNRGPSALMSFAGMESLAVEVCKRYSLELRDKYGLGSNLTCTERILEYDEAPESMNPFVYLDHLREIEDDLIRAEPLLVKWENAVVAKKVKYEKETGNKFDLVPRPRALPTKKTDVRPVSESQMKRLESRKLMSKIPAKDRINLLILDETDKQNGPTIKWPWSPVLDDSLSSSSEEAPGVKAIEGRPASPTPKPITETEQTTTPPKSELPTINKTEPEVYYRKPKFTFTCEVSTQYDIGVQTEEIANKGEARWNQLVEYHRSIKSMRDAEFERRSKADLRQDIKLRPQGVRCYYSIWDPTRTRRCWFGAHYTDGMNVNGQLNYESNTPSSGEWRDPSIYR